MRHMPPPEKRSQRQGLTRPLMTASAALIFRKNRLAQTVAIALLTVSLAGCASTKRAPETTGSIPKVSTASLQGMDTAALSATERSIGAAYVRDPKNRDIGLRYATVLGMTGKSAQALAVMQQVAIAHPADREVLAAYGKAQAAAGQLEQALATINRAQTPDHPDWRLYSA